MSDPLDPRDAPRLPADFSIDDILRVPAEAREPAPPPVCGARVEPAQEARAALWELDFAVQELAWFRREGVDERPLLQSVARQITTATMHVERFPLQSLPMPADLSEALAERFERLSDALADLPPGWFGHEDLGRARSRLQSNLDRRGVDVG
jgi:hypothetical protein